MICQRCRTHLLSRIQIQHHTIRTPSSCVSALVKTQLRCASTDTSKTPAMPPPPAPRQPGVGDVSVPSAISSATPGVSQPLSTPTDGVPEPPAWVNPGKSAAAAEAAATHEPSSCLAGTVLKGINYFKNKPHVQAMEDHEYPDWLWGLLDEKSKKSSESGGVDVESMNKKQRKRHEKKMAAKAAAQPRKIPLHEQTIDITPAKYNAAEQDGPQDITAKSAAALEKKEQITKSAREARRKGIRESNFLRGL